MSEPQKKRRFNLPTSLDETDRLKVGRLIIDRILERTAKNTSVDGTRFPNYSDTYAKSLDFKIAGKSKNDPNLTLTGDMLESLKILEQGAGFVTIGYEEGTPENDKAVWAERSDNGPARKFMGVQDTELEQILAQVALERPTTLRGLADQENIQKNILSNPGNAKSETKQLLNNILKQLYVDTTEEE